MNTSNEKLNLLESKAEITDIEKEKIKKLKEEIINFEKKQKDFSKFLEEKFPLKSFRVFSNINGIFTDNKCELQDYKIYNFEKNKEKLEESFFKKPRESFWKENDYFFILEINVIARDEKTAYKKAKNKNEDFLNILAFMSLKHNLHFNCSIGAKQNIEEIKMNAATDKTLYSLTDFLIDKQTYLIIDSIKEDEDLEKLLILISNKSTNEFQNRILICLKWLKDSLVEEDKKSSLLKGMIALESLFSFKKDTFMTPGITHSIAESLALILGSSLDERIEIEDKTRRLYNKRSSITHTGNGTINANDCQELYGLTVEVILKFINDEKYKNLKKLEELRDIIKKMKYTL